MTVRSAVFLPAVLFQCAGVLLILGIRRSHNILIHIAIGRLLFFLFQFAIADDRFLVKPTASAMAMMPNASKELPYPGAKEMLLVEDVENREFLRELFEAMVDELPEPKKKK